MILAVDLLTGFGAVCTAVAALLAAYATYIGKKNEGQSANAIETAQAFELQQQSMANVKEDNDRLRARNDQMHDRLNQAIGSLNTMTINHQRCEQKLEEAGERIAVLDRKSVV